MLKKGDLILVAVLLVLVLAGYYFIRTGQDGNAARVAVIKQNDKVIRTINLDKVKEGERITISGEYNNVVLVENGNIRYEKADCPDKVCVRTGWLTEKGDIAVCLPNRTLIKIEGENNEVDIIAK